MPSRKPRAVKSTAPSPSPAASSRASSRTRAKKGVEEPVEEVAEPHETTGTEDEDPDEEDKGTQGPGEGGGDESVETDEQGADVAQEDPKGKGKMSMSERLAKMKDLRSRMNQSAVENRKDLIADHQKSKVTAKELQRLEKQKKLAQTLRLKAEAEENGEDMERKKAWEWSIEQNERWEAKQAESAIRSDTHFHDADHEAHKRYEKNIRTTKADLLAYERQKEAAMGLAPGTLVPVNATNESLIASGSSSRKGLTASEDLYRGADTLSYGDSKPSEDAIDRVVGKINKDIGKTKRKKKDDSDEVVTYINERNKVFNKKIARYFDKYTKEIRANFERGTAL
ncbi:SYF2 splicing factor-domain-containing protein [Papiliotrema laurentii]|uniref:Pre-mRNA-splicing factor SYF2 n=2 Tax=Opisthokonta TaxID=33154 RepID=A0AAD9LA74_PAPLA|nr:SYF2 splicing factor-domain-containing protein [Papiliotrema laurentii]